MHNLEDFSLSLEMTPGGQVISSYADADQAAHNEG
jgi:hypothetical protein